MLHLEVSLACSPLVSCHSLWKQTKRDLFVQLLDRLDSDDVVYGLGGYNAERVMIISAAM